MKIIQLVYALGSGGAEKFVVNIANELASLGHDVTVCMLRGEHDPDLIFNKQHLSKDVKFHALNLTKGFSFSKVVSVCKYIKSENPDVVHCNLNVIPYIYPLAITSRKIKFVHTIHSVAEHTVKEGLQVKLNRFFYSKFIKAVTISNQVRESYQSLYGLNNDELIANGAPAITPSEQFEKVRAEVSSLKNTSSDRIFIHVARFHEAKNQELLINAFNELDKQGKNFTLLILGSNFDSEEGMKLQAKACDKIHFLGVKNNVGDYLLCCEAFCLTSHYEGLPISLLEAISAGLTPVCTPAGGIPTVIEDGKNGYLSSDFSVEAYLVALNRFMAEQIDNQSLIEYFSRNFSMRNCAEKYIQLYLQKKS